MPNAADNVTATTSAQVIFRAISNGTPGYDKNGVLAITILNYGSNDLLVKSDGQPDVSSWVEGSVPVVQWIRVPAGKSITLEKRGEAGSNGQINEVQVKAATGTTTISWGATAWR